MRTQRLIWLTAKDSKITSRVSFGVGPVNGPRSGSLRNNAPLLGVNTRVKAIKSLLRSRATTAVAILALAFGIGANTAIFSVVNGVLLQPLPFPEADRLTYVSERTPGGGAIPPSPAAFLEFEPRARSFTALAAFTPRSAVLRTGSGGDRVSVAQVSAGFLEAFRTPLALGRGFLPDEHRAGSAGVVVLNRGAWMRLFGADPSIAGRVIMLDGRPHTVAGVLASDFRFFRSYDLLAPLVFDASAAADRDRHTLTVIGRLKPGATLDRARAELQQVAVIDQLKERVTRGPRNDLTMLVGAAGFVLLIACSNVAGLLIATGTARRREIAVRLSLGATRFRIIRQLLAESVVLGLAGGAGGMAVGFWCVRLLQRAVPVDALPPGMSIEIDFTVLAFTCVLSIVAGAAFGIFPALRVTRVDLQQELKQGSHGVARAGGARLRSFLVASEFALSAVLITGAGLMVRSLIRSQTERPGFDSDNILTVRIDLPETRYKTPAQALAFVRGLLDRAGAVPGVREAGFGTHVPLRGGGFSAPFEIAGQPAADMKQRPTTLVQAVTPGHMHALGILIRRGRGFTGADVEGAPRAVIVNRTFAIRYFKNADPLGQRLRLDMQATGVTEWEIVGVVDSIGLGDADRLGVEAYVPFAQLPGPGGYLTVKTEMEPLGAIEGLRAAVRAVDADVALYEPRSMDQVRRLVFTVPRVLTSILGSFGALALLLAGMGIYGLMTSVVADRTQEIGIRAALGADRGALLRMVLKQAVVLAAIGMGVGALGALALTRVLRRLLYGVAPHDPWALAFTCALLFAATLLATWLPARRAARVEPAAALRM